MDIPVVTDINQKLIEERDCYLPGLISSFHDQHDCRKILENIKTCVKYLSTYDISNVEEKLLRYIMPVIKETLERTYKDNFLLFDTIEDDIILSVLKGNIQVAVHFLNITKDILEYLSQHSDSTCLRDLSNIVLNLSHVILMTLEHCKNSSDAYKSIFNAELLEVFHIVQQVHMLFLKLFECFSLTNCKTDEILEKEVLLEVLDMICKMSEILCDMNVKFMTNNWKGYTTIAHKFSGILKDTIDLKLPLQCLISEINRNLSSVLNVDEIDVKFTCQVLKITSFLIKVALKIFDIFWCYLEKVSKLMLNFCCAICRISPNLFKEQGYPPEILDQLQTCIFNCVDPLICRLSNDLLLKQVISQKNVSSCDSPLGLLHFLNTVLKLYVLSEHKTASFELDLIVASIFQTTKQCYVEFFWESQPMESIFENLLINITATLLVQDNDEYYTKVDAILLEQLQQGYIWCTLLAIEVWSLFLSNSCPQRCRLTLIVLVTKYLEIDSGLFSYKPEQIYLSNMIQRIFKMLPNDMKSSVLQELLSVKNASPWKLIGFNNFTFDEKHIIDGICLGIVNKVEMMERDSFSFNDYIFLMENLELLAKANFTELGYQTSGLVKAVSCLWDFNLENNNMHNSNIFVCFMDNLSKITSNFITEFSNQQLMSILKQINILSTEESYKLLVCNLLSSLSKRNFESEGLNNIGLSLKTIFLNILSTKNTIIIQNTLEVILKFALNCKNDIVTDIVKNSNEMQGHICNFLERKVVPSKVDEAYLELLGSFKFKHECIKWETNSESFVTNKNKNDDFIWKTDIPPCKRTKFDNYLKVDENKSVNERPPEITETKNELAKVDDDCSDKVTEVLDNIKGEVKCLLKILKSEKLSRKNASDIKLISNQMLSLL